MNKLRTVMLTGLCIAVVGCGPAIEAVPFTDTRAEPTTGEVLLFSSKVPDCAYDELGLITGHRRGFFTSLDDVLAKMRERVRAMGGHAIVGLGSSEVVTGASQIGGSVTVDTNDRLAGTVIRFRDADCRH